MLTRFGDSLSIKQQFLFFILLFFFWWKGSFNSCQEILLGVFLPLTGFLGQIMGTNNDVNEANLAPGKLNETHVFTM